MGNLSDLVYHPLLEEEAQTTGWSKETIDFVIKNKSRIYSTIRRIAKSFGKIIQTDDVEDIYSILLAYLYKCDDYNISKAYSDNNLISLEGYVNSCTKYCVIRFITSQAKEDSAKVSEAITDEEGKELSIFDTIADNKNTDMYSIFDSELDKICKMFESDRYTYGVDIFQLWFVRLQTMVYKKQDKYKDILSVLGITRKDMKEMEDHSMTDGAMLSIAKSVSLIGVEEALEVLKNYTYSYKRIIEVIEII